MVLDGTGNNKASSVERKISAAREAGYTVKGHYVTCPTDVAVQRAIVRGEETGRVVPESVVRGTHAGVSRVVPQVASSFDTFDLVDTSGPTPIKVASATKGNPITVENQALYDDFLAKGNE
jgi:predicted ABC-type ATPase